jgi:hypothetical protein
MAGTAVLRIVVSSDSMKNATATSHGKRRLEVSEGTHEDGGALNGPHGVVVLSASFTSVISNYSDCAGY